MEKLLDFLKKSHSAYHAVAGLTECLKAADYTPLTETEDWDLTPGGKYYVNRNGSALLAFRLPEESPRGFMIGASHSDRPTFKVKENGALSGSYTRLSTEKYGGMLMASWLDRPLSVAGRVVVETENGIESRLVDIDRDLLLIPNVAIHLNRKANEGVALNPATDMLPLMGDKEKEALFWQELEKQAGGKILGHDLYLYVRQEPTRWGLEQEYFSAQAIDDLECAWCCTQGFLKAKATDKIPVLCVFDSEEVGSSSYQGAASDFLQSTLTRICGCLNLEEKRQIAGSFMVSADNGHALHPNHPELSDSANAPVLGGGVVLKFNANQKYTTDGVSAAVFRKICQKASVPVQTYCNRADLPGGSTLGNISLSQVGVPCVDIGLAQLAMHSCFETAGVQDVEYLINAMTAFYGTKLEGTPDTGYSIV
ncbi:MAG: M18 family aminopeptidase [Oscillospiraceae bacterium]|nr:M18 family aminopeptidase [Oscillospiraceae bacterium]